MASHEAALGERTRELLVAARHHGGVMTRMAIEEEGPLVRAGTFERTGPEWGLAVDELVDRALAISKRGSMATEETFELTPDAHAPRWSHDE